MTVSNPHYIGRFAPSPSGALHFGSLLAAMASFLDARSQGGQWLLRMEDLDPAREPPGAADDILRLLDALHLHWDGSVLYQSTRLDAYKDALQTLINDGLIFHCLCSRKRVQALNGIYDGRCRHRLTAPARASALRVRVSDDTTISFFDAVQGTVTQFLPDACGDFIVRRKDGLFAYQLAVVVDDAWQQISHVIRGHDLIDSTPRQIYLQQLLALPRPDYAHIPVASNALGQKLSKQHFAAPLALANARENLHKALQFLGQQPPARLIREAPPVQLQWGIEHWDIQKVPALAKLLIEE